MVDPMGVKVDAYIREIYFFSDSRGFMTNIASWLASQWTTWIVSGVFGFIGGVFGGVFKWFYPSRKEWDLKRQEKHDKYLDARVFDCLVDPKIQRNSGGMTESGAPLTRVGDIVDFLDVDRDEVQESLWRLEARGRVNNDGYGDWFPLSD